jgi:hypothetical protein
MANILLCKREVLFKLSVVPLQPQELWRLRHQDYEFKPTCGKASETLSKNKIK